MASRERYSRIWMDSKGALKDAWGRFIKGWTEVEMYQSNIKHSDRIIYKPELDRLLLNNVCEIVFVRRRPERYPYRPVIRRMMCTKSLKLLNSENGFKSLNFRFPKTSRRMNEVHHDIVVVWDIFQQDYRNVSISTPESPAVGARLNKPSIPTCYLRQEIPDDDTFWRYYNDVLYKMSPEQKMSFMDSVS